MSFGQKLKEIRNKKNLTLEELSNKIDLSKGYLSKLENGERKVPKLETISKIATGLEIDPTILLREAWDFQQLDKLKAEQINKEINEQIPDSYIVHKLDKILESNVPESQFLVEYKDHQLTDREKEDIRKFIENFIIEGNE